MNHAASLTTRASMRGLGISLLVHALAVAWLWHAGMPRRTDTDAGPVKRIVVRLVPVAPAAPQAAPAPETVLPRSSSTPAHAAPGPALPQREPSARVVTPAPIAVVPAPAGDAARPTEAGGTGTDAPGVDLATARAMARLYARESSKNLVTLPDRKPVVDANADHRTVDRFERARRVDCQTARAESTNLLANVVLLAVDLAKNAVDDSGCKW
jgi:hypothetical protein